MHSFLRNLLYFRWNKKKLALLQLHPAHSLVLEHIPPPDTYVCRVQIEFKLKSFRFQKNGMHLVCDCMRSLNSEREIHNLKSEMWKHILVILAVAEGISISPSPETDLFLQIFVRIFADAIRLLLQCRFNCCSSTAYTFASLKIHFCWTYMIAEQHRKICQICQYCVRSQCFSRLRWQQSCRTAVRLVALSLSAFSMKYWWKV